MDGPVGVARIEDLHIPKMRWNDETRWNDDHALEKALDLIQGLVSPEAFKSFRIALAEDVNQGCSSGSSEAVKPKAPQVQDKQQEGEEAKDGGGLGQKLTPKLAIHLFQLRPKPSLDGSRRRGSVVHCKVLASKFGVTPKTVRDIWSGRTWFSATKPYWSKMELKRMADFASDAYDAVAAADLALPVIAEHVQPQTDCSLVQNPLAQPMITGGGQAYQHQKAADTQAACAASPPWPTAHLPSNLHCDGLFEEKYDAAFTSLCPPAVNLHGAPGKKHGSEQPDMWKQQEGSGCLNSCGSSGPNGPAAWREQGRGDPRGQRPAGGAKGVLANIDAVLSRGPRTKVADTAEFRGDLTCGLDEHLLKLKMLMGHVGSGAV